MTKRESIAVRRGAVADLDAIVGVEEGSFDSDVMSRRSLRYYLTAPACTLDVATVDGTVAGYGLISLARGHKAARLYSIAVSRHFGRRGLGKRLLDAAETAARARGARTLRLEVRRDNHAAAALYRKSGYALFEEIEDYYEDGETALRFEKTL